MAGKMAPEENQFKVVVDLPLFHCYFSSSAQHGSVAHIQD
jgi:hypothetical protein